MSHPPKLGWRFNIYRKLQLWHFHIFGVSPGVYLQDASTTKIGKNVYIAPNVAMITSNHDPGDMSKNLPSRPILIGDDCWLGFGCVILPGVTLGPHTIVGANAVVTRSFPEGNQVLVGAPARPTSNKENDDK